MHLRSNSYRITSIKHTKQLKMNDKADHTGDVVDAELRIRFVRWFSTVFALISSFTPTSLLEKLLTSWIAIFFSHSVLQGFVP